MLYAYNCFCKTNQIQWKKPYYKFSEKTPIIPTTENVNKIVSNATTYYATIFKILIETGAEAHELEITNRKDIDQEQGIISITGVKMHDSGTYKLKTATAEMLRIYLAKHPEEYPFPTSKQMGGIWGQTRARAAKKLCQPELKKIKMQNLRNYSGAQLYYKIQDPIAVMRHLRHKKLEQTMHYLRGITTGEEEEYTVKTATTTKEAIALLEIGFKYETTIEGIQLYKKRK